MTVIIPVIGAFLFAWYVQMHEVGKPAGGGTDSQRVIRLAGSEFEGIVSTKTVVPPTTYAAYTPIYGSGKEPIE